MSAEERRKLRDIKSADTIDRILNAVEGDMQNECHWHKSCFEVFTDKGKINRLKQSHEHSAGSLEKPPATVLGREEVLQRLTGNYDFYVSENNPIKKHCVPLRPLKFVSR